MKKIKNFVSYILEDVDTPPMIQQSDEKDTSPENKIEISQDEWEKWRDTLDTSAKYSAVELYIDENNSIARIEKPSFRLIDDQSIMIRYTKSNQKDPQLESKLEKLKSEKKIERLTFLSPVDPDGFIMHLGNLKSVYK